MIESFAMGDLTLILLIIAIGIFGSLAIQSRNVKSFQFQISMILILWIFGEVIHLFEETTSSTMLNFEVIPSIIHMIAMIMICIMFWLRFYYAKRSRGSATSDACDWSGPVPASH